MMKKIEIIDDKNEEIEKLIEENRVPTPEKLAYDMGILVQEFETKFNSMQSHSNVEEIRDSFSCTGDIIEELMNVWLKKARLILKNADEIKENINSINKIRNDFGPSFDKFVKLKKESEEYYEIHKGFTPEHIREPIIKVSGILWGVDDTKCNVKMQKAIDVLLNSIRQNI